jgi:hypothetical protein
MGSRTRRKTGGQDQSHNGRQGQDDEHQDQKRVGVVLEIGASDGDVLPKNVFQGFRPGNGL